MPESIWASGPADLCGRRDRDRLGTALLGLRILRDKVKVLAGQVDHRGRSAVGGDEMLVCVSRAKGDRVVVDA